MMARAKPTRFFIPPLKLSGILSSCPSISITSSISLTFERKTFGSRSPASRNGKAMLPSNRHGIKKRATLKENADLFANRPSWRSFRPNDVLALDQISPASGSINPTMCFSKTLLPAPLRQ